MTLKNFLTINAILFVPFGFAMLIVPNLLFPMFGITLDFDGTLMARVFGSALMNLGLICYLVRTEERSNNAVKGILIGNLLFHGIDAVSTSIASFTGVMNTLGWMFTSLHFILAVGFFYFVFKKA